MNNQNQESIPFELHLTVSPFLSNREEEFVQSCQKLGGKPILIELSRGEFQQQPMFTKVEYVISLEQALERARNYALELQKLAYKINRSKIEVPAYCFEKFKAEKSNYFEWHGKIDYINVSKLLSLCEKHSVHLSRNSLKNQSEIRFITLREYGNKDVFDNRVSLLKEALNEGGWKVFKEQAEYCVYDSNCELDKNWLNGH